MTVKADSKGRLTGAQPETRYTRKEHPDGRIEYIPQGLKPTKDGTTLAVHTGPTLGRFQVVVESDTKDFREIQSFIEGVAQVTDAEEVWVRTSGMFGSLFDMLKREERSYEVIGYNPSVRGFEGLE